jgi:type IV pilus assembly protein PilM
VNAAGLTAKIVDVEAFALENACKLMTHQMPDGGIDRTIAVVDFGASSTTFSVLRNLKVVYTRDFAFGGQQLTEEIMRTYGLSMEEAGRAKKEGGLPGNFQAEVLDCSSTWHPAPAAISRRRSSSAAAAQTFPVFPT